MRGNMVAIMFFYISAVMRSYCSILITIKSRWVTFNILILRWNMLIKWYLSISILLLFRRFVKSTKGGNIRSCRRWLMNIVSIWWFCWRIIRRGWRMVYVVSVVRWIVKSFRICWWRCSKRIISNLCGLKRKITIVVFCVAWNWCGRWWGSRDNRDEIV